VLNNSLFSEENAGKKVDTFINKELLLIDESKARIMKDRYFPYLSSK
jgi:hypothetical protein